MSCIKIIESDSIAALELAVNSFIKVGGTSMQVGNVTVGTYVNNENIKYYATVLYKNID